MKKIIISFLFFTSVVFSQKEASNWYFGEKAGIKFNNDGSVTALTDGQLNTNEGCASLSNSNGDLLFYTDGTTVWNKNHQVMQNGTGLMGHPSSSQSATIVPLPGSTTLYYVFTLDAEANANGFRYSIVDLSLDGGLGAVTSAKNILIYTPSNEKLAIVKHTNNTDFWIVTHGWNNNTFYSYLLSSTGLSATPVATNVGIVTTGRIENIYGCMKIAPNGSKLATCNGYSNSELFDFDPTTGVVSNPIILFNGEFGYGVEFSPNSKVLYITVSTNATFDNRRVLQYDLTASDILGSSQIIFKSTGIVVSGLQTGPDGKIYIAEYTWPSLGVINNPNAIGSSCNIQMHAIDLKERICNMGLPPFVSSFFSTPDIILNNSCVGENAPFSLGTYQNITSAFWNFGDGTTSNDLKPSHTYTTPGTFTVTVQTIGTNGSGTKTRDIVISSIPTATKPQNILTCDDNNDGFSSFDLTTQNTAILSGQDTSLYSVTYFANATDYANKKAIVTPTNYVNTTGYQTQAIIAEVSNKANASCKSTTSFDINVFDSPKPNTIVPKISSCDNTSFGTDTDGIIIFDLTQNATAILNGQSASQFVLSYYKDSALSQLITTPTTYANTNASETIYVKMTNKDSAACFGTTFFQSKFWLCQ